jgi:hypothetical protein
MEPSETVPPSKTDAPISSAPQSRLRSPIREVLDELRELTLTELADVQHYAKRIRASRDNRPSPELVSQVVAAAERLRQTFPKRVPISLIRAGLVNVPRALLDQAIFEAQARHLLRIEPVELPAPFIEIGAGIQDERGLLYWIVPF